jgi:site-specific recombinase XerD
MKQKSSNQQSIKKIIAQNDLNDLIVDFLVTKKTENVTPGTIRFYQEKFDQFLPYCHRNGVYTIEGLDTQFLREFFLYLMDDHTPGGVHCYYRVIKTFLLWYEEEEEPDDWKNPIKKIKPPKLINEPLIPVSETVIRALLDTCKPKEFFGERDRLIILMLCDTGARANELLSMQLDDIDYKDLSVLIRQGKGRKPRNVYFDTITRKTLKNYLKLRTDDNPYLIINEQEEKLKYYGLREMIRRRSVRAGVDTPTIHSFRRYFAITMLRSGVDIYTLQKLMGHEDIQVLRVYLKHVEGDLKNAHERHSPVNKLFD